MTMCYASKGNEWLCTASIAMAGECMRGCNGGMRVQQG